MPTRDELMTAAGRMLQDEAAAASRWRVVPPDEMAGPTVERLLFEAGLALDASSAEAAAPMMWRYRNGEPPVPFEQLPGRDWWKRRAALARGEVEPRPLPPKPEPRPSGMSKDRRTGTGLCRRCGAKLRWAKAAATGKAMPLDPEPPEGTLGNILIDGTGRAVVFSGHEAAVAARAVDIENGGPQGITGEPTTTHFATCPVVVAEREAADAKKKAERIDRLGGEQIGLEL